jgi:hypothetical protein
MHIASNSPVGASWLAAEPSSVMSGSRHSVRQMMNKKYQVYLTTLIYSPFSLATVVDTK